MSNWETSLGGVSLGAAGLLEIGTVVPESACSATEVVFCQSENCVVVAVAAWASASCTPSVGSPTPDSTSLPRVSSPALASPSTSTGPPWEAKVSETNGLTSLGSRLPDGVLKNCVTSPIPPARTEMPPRRSANVPLKSFEAPPGAAGLIARAEMSAVPPPVSRTPPPGCTLPVLATVTSSPWVTWVSVLVVTAPASPPAERVTLPPPSVPKPVKPVR